MEQPGEVEEEPKEGRSEEKTQAEDLGPGGVTYFRQISSERNSGCTEIPGIRLRFHQDEAQK